MVGGAEILAEIFLQKYKFCNTSSFSTTGTTPNQIRTNPSIDEGEKRGKKSLARAFPVASKGFCSGKL